MRSNEVAKMAGVTVRTLRHYHQLGLLPEPPRLANGYRDYTAADLARVLRIKRLASLGFPLSCIGDLLDEMDGVAPAPSGDATPGGPAPDGAPSSSAPAPDSAPASASSSALDELDRELALQIEALQEQRRTIALLKAEGLDPDLPVRFARVLKSLSNRVPTLAGKGSDERTMLLLASHLYSEQELAELERIAALLQDERILQPLAEVEARLDRLAPDASEEEQDRLVAAALEAGRPLIAHFDAANWLREPTEGDRLLDEFSNADLNPAQLRVSEAIERGIEALVAEAGAEAGATPATPA